MRVNKLVIIVVSLGLFLSLILILALNGCSSATTPTPTPTGSTVPTTVSSPTPTAKPTISAPVSTTSLPPTLTTSPSPTTPTPTSNKSYGGILKILQPPSIGNLGYPGAIDQPNDPIYSRPAVETLVAMDPAGTGKVVPLLATNWQYSADGKSLTFTLRQGVKFQDGTDFNADAAKFCLDLFKKGAKPDLNSVASIDVVDKYTLRLNLSLFDPSLLTNMSNDRAGMMVSPTAVQQMGMATSMVHPVGTGPFKFVEYQQDAILKYDRWDGYWGDKAFVDSIYFILVADPVSAVLDFKSGGAQVVRRITASQARDLQNEGFAVKSTPSNILGIAGDSKNSSSPFANLKVRQAISYAIDTKSLVNTLSYGFYTLTNQWAIPGSQGYNPKVVGYPYNVQKAKQLMADAGYTSALNTKLTFDSGGPGYPDVFAVVQANLAAIGINTTLDSAPTSRAVALTSQGWTNQLINYRLNLGIGVDLGSALAGSLSNKASNYVSVLVPADYQTKLTQANSEVDPVKREAALEEVSRTIIDDYCLATPIFVSQSLWAANQQVHDLDVSTFSAYDWNPGKVWLSK